MIIDCHIHLNRYVDSQRPLLCDRIALLESEMRQNRVDVAIVLSSYKNNESRPSIHELLEATRGKDHLCLVAGVSFSYTKDDLDALRIPLSNGEIVGLKIYPGYEPFYPHDDKMRAVYQLAEDFDVPVMIHSGDTYAPSGKVKYAHPLHIDEIAVDHPKVNFIICHMGNPWFVDTMEILYKNANVYSDLSGLVLGDFSDRFERYMVRRFQDFILFGVEPSKLLFGTDWPIATIGSYLRFMDELKIPIQDKNEILYHNAARLFKISEDNSLIRNYARGMRIGT